MKGILNLITNDIKSASSKVLSKGKSIVDMIIDSLIIAGITCFSIWSGEPTITQFFIVIKATLTAFFIQLAYEKGIKKEKLKLK